MGIREVMTADCWSTCALDAAELRGPLLAGDRPNASEDERPA